MEIDGGVAGVRCREGREQMEQQNEEIGES